MILLSWQDLAWAGGLVVMLAGVVWWQRLGVARELLVSAFRMVVQLSLVGLVLKVLLAQESLVWVMSMASVMVIVAGREVVARQQHRVSGWGIWLVGTGSLMLSSFVITCFALLFLIQADPWYEPQYAIPLLGMLLGNTMNGVALSMDRLTSGVWRHRNQIEQRLMLGETPSEATKDLVRESVRAGLIPIVNAMAVAGLVSLPGMMTGQILAGVDPVVAVRYQIMIWLMIAVASGVGMLLAVRWSCAQLFDVRERLRPDRLQRQRG